MQTEQKDYRMIKESLYMNRYLWKLGTEEAVYFRELKQEFINCVVYPFINKIRQNVSRIFPECKVEPVGSLKDETQVGIPNEFDFIFEIPDVMSLADYSQSENCLQILPVNIPVTGPQQSRDIINRTYVNLSLSHPWGQFGQDDDPCLLDAHRLQSRFQRCIEETLQKHNSPNIEFIIKLKGPAVCVSLAIQTSTIEEYATNSPGLQKVLSSLGTYTHIKINFVFGITFDVLPKSELHLKNKEMSWRVGNAFLTDNVRRINKCHLVFSGKFFRISFCLFEAQIINQEISTENVHSQVKGACIRSIKVCDNC